MKKINIKCSLFILLFLCILGKALYATDTLPSGKTSSRMFLTSSEKDLITAFAYPVPFKAGKTGHKNIIFSNLSSSCDIKIFTLSGELVKSIDHNSETNLIEKWDIKTDSGEKVLSGVYVYYIKSEGDNKIGKLMIIR